MAGVGLVRLLRPPRRRILNGMGTPLSPQDASAYEALDRLLFREWDPIGVCAPDGPEDEYRMYLPKFWTLAKSGTSPEEIAAYLGAIEVERIGLTTSLEHRLDTARKAAALIDVWSMPVRP